MKQNTSFLLMSFPLAVFIILGLFLLVERTGAIYGQQSHIISLLDAKAISRQSPNFKEDDPKCLLMYNNLEEGWNDYFQTVQDTLFSMRVKCDIYNLNLYDAGGSNKSYDLSKYQTVVITFREWMSDTQLKDLVQWVAAGGRVFFAVRPENSPILQPYIHELGINTIASGYITVNGVKFVSDFMPGGKDLSLPSVLENDESLKVVLDKNAQVHLTSADVNKIPLLWSYDYGKGRFVVVNTGNFNDKLSRGVIGAAYSLLQDEFIYPVINSSTFFIDDFPAPIAELEDPNIKSEYNMNYRDFIQKIWWPDMYALAQNFGLKYTTVIVETYNNTVQPPFEQYNNIDDFRYYGGYLLKSGGILGIHGYNHIPFCLAKDGANQLYDYPSWPSVENMKTAFEEVYSFAHLMYPGRTFSVYVPPSNVLCPDMRQAFPKIWPELKVISSLYLPGDPDQKPYVQEFKEADDGIVEMPRITSGFWMNDAFNWAVINEISLHYVNSHFVHPDDVLNDIRSSNSPWKNLYGEFDNHIKWLVNSAPGMRQLTAEDGAAAVQRFARLKVNAKQDQGSYVVNLSNFYDEAWLMLRSTKKPSAISGGTITQVTPTLYLIHALEPEIRLDY
jgi:hypothetical protein